MNKHFTLNGWKMMCCLLFGALFFSTSLTAQSVLATRNVSNTTQCSNGTDYGLYILIDGEDPYHTLSWANFTEYSDGTATLVGSAVNNSDSGIQFNVNIDFSGRTFTAPADSPKEHSCSSPSSDDWYYYATTSGTLMGVGNCWGTVIDITGNLGPAFQLGNGANVTNDGSAFGGSGWLMMTVTSQNSWGPQIVLNSGSTNGQNGDINIDLSGTGLTPPTTGTCDNVNNGGTIGSDQTVCAGTAAATLSGTAPTGGSGNLEYLWLSSTSSCPTSLNQQIAGANAATYNPGVLSQTTYFVRCSRRAGCDSWTQGESNCVTVTVDTDPACGNSCDNVTSGGTIGGTQTVCSGDAAATLTNNTAPSGGSGGVEYLWLSSTNSCPTNLNQQIAGANGATYNPGTLSQTTYFVRCSRRAGCDSWTQGESNCVTVTVDTNPSCGGGGGGTAGDCSDITVTTGSGTIVVGGLDGAPITSVQVFTSDWSQTLLNCFGDCDSPTQTITAANGSYLVYVKYYTAGYSLVCEVNETVTVGGGGGVTDNDNDGVPAGEDCDDNDPSVPTTPGTTCNDGNGNTSGDVIQADGCTCAGTPDGGVTDNDNDGVPAGQDCDDNDPSVPTTPGTTCNDGNGNTSGDVIQADGCTCAGTPDTGGQGVDLKLTINGDGAQVAPYTSFSVTVVAMNQGTTTSNNVVVNIPQPANVVFSGGNAASATQGTYDAFSTFNWTVGTLAPGQSETLTLNYFSLAGSPYTVYGQIQSASGTDSDSTPGNGTAPTPNEDDEDVYVTGGGGGGNPTCDLNLVASVSGVTCDNNGTPNNANDDTFTFNVTVTGGNPWGWTGGGLSGDMGQAVSFGPFAISGGNATFTIVDNDNADCTVDVNVTPPATCSNGGGVTDNDNDGVPAGEDCDDNDPSVPTTPGTTCNDGNGNTNNDVIQADGCTCAGTPDTGGEPDCADITISSEDGKIIVEGLDGAPIVSVQIFTTDWSQTLLNCFGDCDVPMTMVDVPAGDYLVYVKYYTAGYSFICQVEETVTVGGGGGPTGDVSLTCGNNVTVSAAPGANSATATYSTPNASTTCTAGGLNLQRIAGPASGSSFPLGTTTITYQATDACGNNETCSFTVTVNATNANLNINCGNNISVNAAPGANSATVTYSTPTANTTCAGGATVTRTAGPASGSTFPVGTTTVTYQATDNCGNVETCSFTVTVVGSASNVTISCPSNITVATAPGANSAIVTYGNANANTNCADGGLNVSVTQGPASGASFNVGTTTVRYTATDACGGTATCTFTVTVTATPAPVVPCETRTVSNATSGCGDNDDRGFYAGGLITGTNAGNQRYNVSNATLEEFEDGTATLTAHFRNHENTNIRWDAVVTFSGRTFTAPANSPKESDCYNINDNDFYYYTSASGTLTGTNAIAGAVINISLLDQAMQFGTGASLNDEHLFGASAWLDYTIVSQPTNTNRHLETGAQVDFNWVLTGGQIDCSDAPTEVLCDLDVLFVVGNTTLSAGDNAVRNRLTSQGYNVMLEDAHSVETSDANGKDLVIISSTVSSSVVGTKFQHVTVPVITWESYLFDDMKMTGTSTGTSYGSQSNVDRYTVATSHPINSGLSGTFDVFTSHQSVNWGYPYAVANDVGYIPGNPNKCMIIAYDTDEEMYSNFHAPARRVGFFLSNNSATNLTANGWRLFDQAIQWLTNCTPSTNSVDTQGGVVAQEAELRTNEEAVASVAFGIYPNPATTSVNVSLKDANGAAVVINVYDQLGRLVERAEADAAYDSVYRINTADFNAGLYLISVQSGDAPATTKQFVILPH